MRRHALFTALIIGGFCSLTPALCAQEATDPAPARQETEENYKILTARLDDLAAANEALLKNLNKLKEDVQKLQEEVARNSEKGKDTATIETIKQLKNAIEEVDKKRLADQDLVMAELKNIRQFLEKSPAPRNPGIQTQKDTHTENKNRENGYNYAIQDGDTLSEIVAALKKKGIKVTMKQIMDANPGVNWNRLKINQIIFIPASP